MTEYECKPFGLHLCHQESCFEDFHRLAGIYWRHKVHSKVYGVEVCVSNLNLNFIC